MLKQVQHDNSIMTNTDTTFVDIDNSRVEEQKKVMDEILDQAHCPFCEENLRTYHKQPIIKETAHWIATTNQWPYENTKYHFLLITKEHLTNITELNSDAGKELIELTSWLINEYKIPGGGLAVRFGDTNYSAGTVAHLHAQLIQPDPTLEDYQPVRVKLGKYKEQIEKSSNS